MSSADLDFDVINLAPSLETVTKPCWLPTNKRISPSMYHDKDTVEVPTSIANWIGDEAVSTLSEGIDLMWGCAPSKVSPSAEYPLDNGSVGFALTTRNRASRPGVTVGVTIPPSRQKDRLLHLILPKEEGSFFPFSAFLLKTLGSQVRSKCDDIADVIMPQSIIKDRHGDLIISAQSLINTSTSLKKSYLDRQEWYGSFQDVSGHESICSAVQSQAFIKSLEQGLEACRNEVTDYTLEDWLSRQTSSDYP